MSERRVGLRILAEGVLIVLSVLLALALDSWREQRALDELRDDALDRIRAELAGNLSAIRAVTPYHDSIIAAAQRALADRTALEGRPAMQIAQSVAPRGLQPPLLQTTAWDAAVAAEAVALFEFDTASLIARVYGYQRDGVDASVQRLADRIFTAGMFEPGSGLAQMMLLQAMLGEIRSQEESLAESYELAIAELAALQEQN